MKAVFTTEFRPGPSRETRADGAVAGSETADAIHSAEKAESVALGSKGIAAGKRRSAALFFGPAQADYARIAGQETNVVRIDDVVEEAGGGGRAVDESPAASSVSRIRSVERTACERQGSCDASGIDIFRTAADGSIGHGEVTTLPTDL